MVVLAAQPRRRHLQLLGIPDLDRLGADAGLHHFPLEPGRHRVGVVLHPDGAALTHLHPQPHQALQTPRRQVTQVCHFLLKPRLSARVTPIAHFVQEGLVLATTREIPAATHQQRLLHGFLEAIMGLFIVAVLMAAGRVGRLGRDAIVGHQSLVVPREHFQVAVGMHGQRHAIGAMTLGHAAQGPQRVLQAFAQAGETLGKAHRDVLPVRVGQHEVIHQMVEALTRDGHFQGIHVGEVRRAEPARFMHLHEEQLLGRPMQRPPPLDAPLQRPQQLVAILSRVTLLQQGQQRLRLQPRRPLQFGLQLRPHRRQRIDSRPPRPVRFPLAGHLSLPVIGRRFAVHARLQGRHLQRRTAP